MERLLEAKKRKDVYSFSPAAANLHQLQQRHGQSHVNPVGLIPTEAMAKDYQL